MEFPAEIERHLFTKVHVLANPNYAPSDEKRIQSSPISRIEVKEMDEDGYLYAAIQRVQMMSEDSSSIPYEIDVECFGQIRITPSVTTRGERHQAAVRVAHQVLYAAVREMIASVTSRSVHGPMTIGLAFLSAAPSPEDKLPAKKQSKVSAPKGGGKPIKRAALPKRTVKGG